jgi:hypothetical protein
MEMILTKVFFRFEHNKAAVNTLRYRYTRLFGIPALPNSAWMCSGEVNRLCELCALCGERRIF